MSHPIKSPVTMTQGSPQGGVSGASEMVARLQAQARGMAGQTAPQSFASLMTQQGQALQSAQTPEATKTPEKQVPRQAPSSDPAVRAQAAARANEQVMVRAREQALVRQRLDAQSRGAQPEVQSPPVSPALDSADKTTKQTANQGAQTSSARREGREGEKTQATAGRSVSEGDEAGPDSAIPVGDPAAMMAWLTALRLDAKADRAAGSSAQLAGEQMADGVNAADLAALAATEAGLAGELGTIDAAGAGAGAGADGAGVGLDPAQWQQATEMAGLQMDELLGRAGTVDLTMDAGVETGGVSALGSGGGLRPGSAPLAAPLRQESATLSTPFGHADFSQALADKVSLWVNTARTQGPMTAELHLNPADMGPIQVKIALEGQSAQIDFAVAAAETRKAIEASLSALSSALSDVGLNLTGGGVSSQTAQQSFGQQSNPSSAGAGDASGSLSASSDAGSDGDAGVMRAVNAPLAGRPGGLDLYA